jgi:hypothetical protein
MTNPNNNQIRFVSQTVQEREIVKTAPDLIVYLEGFPYLINYFIDDPNSGNDFTIVNFNDYVTSFNCSYDTESLIPSASIGLEVPNFLKHLFVMPGGNNLIQSMMQVQVFAKGYYMSNSGDTVYRRVFKGLVSGISYADNGKILELQLHCYGSLHFLELMQINLAPANIHNGTKEVHAQEYQSIFHGLDPYQIIAGVFLLGFQGASGFDINSINQGKVSAGLFGQSVEKGYISKWESILANLANDVHLYGVQFKDQAQFTKLFKKSEVKGVMHKDELPDAQTYHSVYNEVTAQKHIYYQKIRQYLPDNIVSPITNLNNKIMSRMEILRHYVGLINFEAYQDVDGLIIIKPPLYNLDVTELGPRDTKAGPTTSNQQQVGSNYYSIVNPLTAINPQTNPFIINLSEILTEQETEDQAAIRKTRITCNGIFNPGFPGVQQNDVMAVVDYIDVQKLKQFGLREEPAITLPWVRNGDMFTLWAYAVTELSRANLAYRTYTVTIPMRPELKVGFPCFIPHKDMYGYIKSIQLNYQVGSTATMSLTLVGLRRRVLLPTEQTTADGTKYTAYTSAPNLVYKYVKGAPQNGPNPNQSPGTNYGYFQDWYQTLTQGNQVQYGQTGNSQPDVDDPANPMGVATTPLPATPNSMNTSPQSGQSLVATDHQLIIKTWSESTRACDFRTQQDTTSSSWQAQNDTAQTFGKSGTYPNNSKPRLVDQSYINDTRKTIPYTDDKGYELVGVLPWGRWQNLRTALLEFTSDGYITATTDLNGNPAPPPDLTIVNNQEALVFAGLGTPTATAQSANQLITALSDVQNAAINDTVIVLQYNAGQSNDSQLLNTAQPDTQNRIISSELTNSQVTEVNMIDVLVSGQVAPTNAVKEAFAAAITPVPTVPSVQGLNTVTVQNAPTVSSTPTQDSTELDQYQGPAT